MPKQESFFNFNESEMDFYEDTHHSKFLPKANQPKSPAKAGAGIIIYEPYTPEDVQALIDRLKTGESAIVNLDKAPYEIAQRILDILSGAVYALGGSMSRIQKNANIYLLTTAGMVISAPFHE